MSDEDLKNRKSKKKTTPAAPDDELIWNDEIDSESLRGKRIGQYTISELLGEGAMGAVYKASDATGAVVALKLLEESPLMRPSMIERFKREAEATKELRKHPNIITVYETGHQGRFHYIAMECISGGETLEDLILDGPVPENKALNYALETADALSFAHKHGIIHRDIKPANIMLNEFDQWLEGKYLNKKTRKDRSHWNDGIKRKRPIAIRENRQWKPAVSYCRYADDFVLGFQHRSDAQKFLGELRARLGSVRGAPGNRRSYRNSVAGCCLKVPEVMLNSPAMVRQRRYHQYTSILSVQR